MKAKTKYILLLFITLAGIKNAGAQVFISTQDSLNMKYLAGRIKDPRAYIGVFHKPDLDEALRPLKNGTVVEEQEGYLSLRQKSILKLYTVSPAGQDFDSVIFVQNPAAKLIESHGPSFYPYSNTTWLLVLRKCIRTEGAITKKNYWMESMDNSTMPWLNTTTAYALDDPSKGSFYLQWNKQFEVTPSAIPMKPKVAQDVLTISQAYKALPNHLSDEVKQQTIQTITPRLQTPEGRILLVELLSR